MIYMLFCLHSANSYAERLRLGLAVIHGEPKDGDPEEEDDDDDERTSPPPPSPFEFKRKMSSVFPGSKWGREREGEGGREGGRGERREGEGEGWRRVLIKDCVSTYTATEKEKPPMNVVGDVHGKIAIMIVSGIL